MKDFERHQSLSSKLRAMYESGSAAQLILDHFTTISRRSTMTTVDQLEEVRDVSQMSPPRQEIITVLRRLEDLSLGVFKTGRRGAKSRFEWAPEVHLGEIGRLAVGEEEQFDQPQEVSEVEPLLQHSYRLRPTLIVRFELPADLTQQEATRLSGYVKTLSFDLPSVDRAASATTQEQQ